MPPIVIACERESGSREKDCSASRLSVIASRELKSELVKGSCGSVFNVVVSRVHVQVEWTVVFHFGSTLFMDRYTYYYVLSQQWPCVDARCLRIMLE